MHVQSSQKGSVFPVQDKTDYQKYLEETLDEFKRNKGAGDRIEA